MVGMYEPYIEVCRQLAELSPCRGQQQKSLLLNTGAEAVENAVKIARVATGRPAVVVFDNAFHGRTLLTMTMTAKVKPYKAGDYWPLTFTEAQRREAASRSSSITPTPFFIASSSCRIGGGLTMSKNRKIAKAIDRPPNASAA